MSDEKNVLTVLAARKETVVPEIPASRLIRPVSRWRLANTLALLALFSALLALPFAANNASLDRDNDEYVMLGVVTAIALAAAYGGTPFAVRAGLADRTFARTGRLVRSYVLQILALAVATAFAWMLFFSFFHLAEHYYLDARDYPGNGAQLSLLFLETGIVEELAFRWLLLSGAVGVLAWVLRRNPREIGSWFFIANLAIAIVFSLSHLDIYRETGLDADALVFRTFAGLLFGTIYRRMGIEAAMLTHGVLDIGVGVVLTQTAFL